MNQKITIIFKLRRITFLISGIHNKNLTNSKTTMVKNHLKKYHLNFQTWSRKNLDFYSKNSNMENWIFFARISKHGKLFKIEYFWRENSSMVIFQNWYFWREISKMLIFEIDNLAQKFKNGKLTFLAQKFKQGKLFKIEYFWRKNSNLLNFQNWHFWRENSNLVNFS